jgi:hypothetical protein
MAGYTVKISFYIMYKYVHWPHATRLQRVATPALSLLPCDVARVCNYVYIFRIYFNCLDHEDRAVKFETPELLICKQSENC